MVNHRKLGSLGSVISKIKKCTKHDVILDLLDTLKVWCQILALMSCSL